jgi:hypothetical protein
MVKRERKGGSEGGREGGGRTEGRKSPMARFFNR